MKSIGIVLMCIVAAVIYGIVHDQITARICVEYFTIGHENLFGTSDPTLLGLGWGVVATWWVGLPLGIGLAWAARHGARPVRSVGSLVRPIAGLLAVTGCCAVLAGIIGWLAARYHLVVLTGEFASMVPANRHVAFLTDLWIHSASYFAGTVGGVVMCVLVWRSRRSTETSASP
jgi:hypothetical protein